MHQPSPIVSIQWLAQKLGQPNLIVLDASMAPPGQPTYVPAAIIPSAQRFDFDKQVCDLTSDLPHMMPTPAAFTEAARALGINRESVIVVFDHLGLFASPRAWWMFKSMGHKEVYVLDGGLPAWINAGNATTTGYSEPLAIGNFVATDTPNLFVSASQVLQAIENSEPALLDARPLGRFNGEVAEPRAGLKSGHMPGAISIPFTSVQTDGFLLNAVELAERFGDSRAIICTCGSGVTACVLALAAVAAGFSQVAVYDGSWSEWGRPELGLPVVSQ